MWQNVDEIEVAGHRGMAPPVPHLPAAPLSDAAARTLAAFGPLDVLVNAVGTDVAGPVLDLAMDDWNRVFHINLCARFVLVQHWYVPSPSFPPSIRKLITLLR